MKKTENNTIVFSFDNDSKTSRNNTVISTIAYTLTAGGSAAAFTGSLCALTETEMNLLQLIAVSLVSAAVLNVIWCFSGRKGAAAKCGYIAAVLVLTIIKLFYVRNGAAMIVNGTLAQVGAFRRKIYLDIAVTCSEAQTEVCIAWAVLVITAAAVLMMTLIAREQNRIAAGMIFLMIAVLNVFFGNDMSAVWLIAAGVCTLVIFAAGFAAGAQTAVSRRSIIFPVLIFTVLVAALAGTVLWKTGTMENYSRAGFAADTADSVSQHIYENRYGDDALRGMPGGDFSELDSLRFSGEPMLEIDADKYESLYLRGFTGTVYSKDGWSETDGKDLYSNADDFYWLHDAGFFGQNQLSYAAANIDKKVSEDTITMKVTNVGADRRYYYTPYELVSLESSDDGKKSVSLMNDTVLDDGSFIAGGYSGGSSYTMGSLTNQVKRYPALTAKLAEQLDKGQLSEYEARESRYNHWVYSVYTDIPEATAKLLANHLGSALDKPAGEDHVSYKKAKEKILNCLNKEIKYDTDVAERSEDTDFLQDFMEISRSGYSVHYATAATMMFRYYGIPARYVEGYLITPDAAKKANEEGRLTITDNDSHAWVEYYQDGIGWIPFEVTPPYMDVMEQPQQLSAAGSSGSSGSLGSAGQSLEMDKDNYEPKEPEKKNEENDIPLRTIIMLASILLILCAAALLTWHFIRRHRRLRKLRASFEDTDLKSAVIEIFAYIMLLHEAAGIPAENCSIYDYREAVRNLAGESYSERYRKTANIYQKAVYSRIDISADERQYAADYKDDMLLLLKKQSSLMKRLKLRWVKGLY